MWAEFHQEQFPSGEGASRQRSGRPQLSNGGERWDPTGHGSGMNPCVCTGMEKRPWTLPAATGASATKGGGKTGSILQKTAVRTLLVTLLRQEGHAAPQPCPSTPLPISQPILLAEIALVLPGSLHPVLCPLTSGAPGGSACTDPAPWRGGHQLPWPRHG